MIEGVAPGQLLFSRNKIGLGNLLIFELLPFLENGNIAGEFYLKQNKELKT